MMKSNENELELRQIKDQLICKRTQLLVFSPNGEIFESCNTIAKFPKGSDIYEAIPFLKKVKQEFDSGFREGFELIYPPTRATIVQEEGIFSFIISNSDSQNGLLNALIFNFTPSIQKSANWRTPGDVSVLIVEDHPINQAVIGQILKQKGYKFESAYNGLEAIEKLKVGVFDVILLDLHMPKMDGMETLAYIRNHLDLPGKAYPVIAITGSIDVSKLDQDHIHQFDAVLSKPPDAYQLHETIMDLVNGNKTDHSAKPKYVDLGYLQEVAGDNIKLIKELIDIFLLNIPIAVEDMNKLSRQKDWLKLKDIAHKTKANFKYVGVNTLFQLADEIEKKAFSGKKTEEIPSLISRLSEIASKVMDELQIHRNKLS